MNGQARTTEEREKAEDRLVRRQDAKKRKLAEAGIDYDFEDIAYVSGFFPISHLLVISSFPLPRRKRSRGQRRLKIIRVSAPFYRLHMRIVQCSSRALTLRERPPSSAEKEWQRTLPYNFDLTVPAGFAFSFAPSLEWVTTTCGFSSCGPVSCSLGLSDGLSSDGSDGSPNAESGIFSALGGMARCGS